jgi:hypothetical protein
MRWANRELVSAESRDRVALVYGRSGDSNSLIRVHANPSGHVGKVEILVQSPGCRENVGAYGLGLPFCCEFPFGLTLLKSGTWTQSPPWRVIFE